MQDRAVQSQCRAVIEAAAYVADAVFREGRPADRLLSDYLRRQRHLGSRDRRIISDLVFAFFRWWGWLRVLRDDTGSNAVAAGEDPLAHRPIPPDVWTRILLGAAVLDGLPLSPVVDLWAREHGLDLRGADARVREGTPAERMRALLPPRRRTRRLAAFDDRDLVPRWVEDEVAQRPLFGRMLTWLQKRPPLWLRVQRGDAADIARELADAGLSPVAHPAWPDALRLTTTRVNLYELPAYREGRVEIQDLASQLVGHLCRPRPGERWWDACAGAGGKSLHLAALMAGKGRVVATDRSERRLQELARRARRGGFSNIAPKNWTGSRPRQGSDTFDGVLVDAPCSGSGTWRRNPHARWTLTREELARMAALQQRLLENASAGVKPGGTLVYATCSFLRCENEDTVARFLERTPGFTPDPFAHPLTGEPVGGATMIWPWEGDCDAMFMARFRRREQVPAAAPDREADELPAGPESP